MSVKRKQKKSTYWTQMNMSLRMRCVRTWIVLDMADGRRWTRMLVLVIMALSGNKKQNLLDEWHQCVVSVRRSSPRTAKRPRTGLDWTDLGPDCSPGPTLVLSGPVLVLKILWDVKDWSWTSPDRS